MSEFTKRSFTSGEIDPALRARVDLNKYHTALDTCKNFICLPEGGVLNRPGFQYIDTDRQSSLIPFQFNQSDSYMLSFSDNLLTVYRYGVKVHEVVSPYTYEEMTTAQYIQNADVMTFAHINHPLTTLTRFADNNWVFDEVEFSATQLPPSGLTVETIGTDSEAAQKQYDYVVTAVIDGKESGQSEEASIIANALSETWGNKLTWSGSADSFNIYKSVSPSTRVYGWIGNSKTNTFTDYNIAPLSSEGVVKQANPFNSIDITANITDGEIQVGQTLSNGDFTGEVSKITGTTYTLINVTGKPVAGGVLQTDRIKFQATGNIEIGATITNGVNRGVVIDKVGNDYYVEIINGTFNNGDAIQISGATDTTYKVSLAVPETITETVTVNPNGSRTIVTTTINRDGSKTETTRIEFPDASGTTGTEAPGANPGEVDINTTTTTVFNNSSANTTRVDNFATPTALVDGQTFTSPNGATGTLNNVSTLFGNEQTFQSDDINGSLAVGDTIYIGGTQITITDVYQGSVNSAGTIDTAPTSTLTATVDTVIESANPSVINQYQQRLLLANTLSGPQTTYASRTSDYYDFRTSEPVGDSDSIEFTIASGQVNEIRHIVSMREMILLTSSGVWRVTEGLNEVLTPASAGVRRISHYGSSKVRPLLVGSSALFIEEKGSRIRDLYNITDYESDDLSILSQHLFKDHEIISWCYQKDPHGVIWAVRDDGVLLGLTYHKKHQVWGWHVHETDGEFVSVGCITEETDIKRDAVYVNVKRGNQYYVERLAHRLDDTYENFRFCDSYIVEEFTTPVRTMDRPAHLVGFDIVTIADGFVQEWGSNDTIQFNGDVTHVVVGLPYECDLKTLELDGDGMNTTGKNIQVPEIAVKLEQSLGGWAGQTFDELREFKYRRRRDDYNVIKLHSEDITLKIDSGWEHKGQVCVRQKQPLPIHILAIKPRVIMGGTRST